MKRRTGRVGVWLVGVRGGLATTVITGAFAIARKLRQPIGLLTETPLCDGLPLAGFDQMVFGGHDIRVTTTRAAALEVGRDIHSIDADLCRRLARPMARVDEEVRVGTARNAGRAIEALASGPVRKDQRMLRSVVDRLRRDLATFQRRNRLRRVIVVNLSSTEPSIKVGRVHQELATLDRTIDDNDHRVLRPSTLYAYAAAAEGCPFIHFTPSNATLVPAICELFDRTGTPYMGSDGKTGETLVKSALAPMFKYRNLRVLAWQGYNLLGDRDGAVLAEGENKRSKIASKDALLSQILGYPLQTHVAIDFVESLGDHKTAWDFIHFQGFLGVKMHMQFSWHGCDAILAAPLVLDMVRLADHAAERGSTGPMTHLACFFKRPMGSDVGDLHRQWHLLEAYARGERAASSPGAASRVIAANGRPRR